MSGTRASRSSAKTAAAVLLAMSGGAQAFELEGHRGARALAPENTLAGFAEALRIGVTTLEMDLAVTRDGIVVVSHDAALNPDITRGPDGAWLSARGPAIRELTLEELQGYDVGRIRPGTRYFEQFPQQEPADGARIPTLAEVAALVARAGAKTRFNLEIKTSPERPDLTPPPEDFAGLVVAEIDRLGIAERSVVQSFDWRGLAAVHAKAPHIATTCLTAEQRWLDNVRRGGASPWLAGRSVDDHDASVPDLVAAFGCEVWSPFHGDLTPADLARAHELGLRVIAWTVNDAATMSRLIAWGVDGLITDDPPRLRAVMAQHDMELPEPVDVE